MTKPVSRYRDTGYSHTYSTTDNSWVICPRCQGPALVQFGTRIRTPDTDGFSAHRLTCTRCSYQRGVGDVEPYLFALRKPEVDPCFGLPYWLTIDTRHGKLWAQNGEHLDEIEALVGARIRERQIVKDRKGRQSRWIGGKSLLTVLPRWVKAAKNREDVLDAVQKLRKKLAEISPRTPY